MPYSYNGWYASRELATRPLVVAGESFTPGILDNDDVYEVLKYVAEQMNARVEPIVRDDWHQADDWGYHYKPSAGDDDELSNHSSGTAFDYNSTRHPFNQPHGFSAAQVAEIDQILREVDNVVEWGGRWSTPDGMHFEIAASYAEVARVANNLRNREKDWFDMATKVELKDAVREVIVDELRAIKQSIADLPQATQRAVWDRMMLVTNLQGEEVKKETSKLLRETWEKTRLLTK